MTYLGILKCFLVKNIFHTAEGVYKAQTSYVDKSLMSINLVDADSSTPHGWLKCKNICQ